ncbi:MAG: hypothetical protein ACLFUF_07850 [Opitutales bacterium]
MTPAGWIIMTVSICLVLTLFVWSIYKVLSVPEESEHVHGFERNPPDVEN